MTLTVCLGVVSGAASWFVSSVEEAPERGAWEEVREEGIGSMGCSLELLSSFFINSR